MSSPLPVVGAAMAWIVLCTGASASVAAAAGAGAIAAADIDLEGALSLASFLTSYNAVLGASVSLAYSAGRKVILLVNCIPDVTLVGTQLLLSLLDPHPRSLPPPLPS
jgi:hypothetical protein